MFKRRGFVCPIRIANAVMLFVVFDLLEQVFRVRLHRWLSSASYCSECDEISACQPTSAWQPTVEAFCHGVMTLRPSMEVIGVVICWQRHTRLLKHFVEPCFAMVKGKPRLFVACHFVESRPHLHCGRHILNPAWLCIPSPVASSTRCSSSLGCPLHPITAYTCFLSLVTLTSTFEQLASMAAGAAGDDFGLFPCGNRFLRTFRGFHGEAAAAAASARGSRNSHPAGIFSSGTGRGEAGGDEPDSTFGLFRGVFGIADPAATKSFPASGVFAVSDVFGGSDRMMGFRCGGEYDL